MLNRVLLWRGVASAPFFCLVLAWQIFVRPFDVYRTPLSLLSLGDLGWVQILNFIVTGVLALAGAQGVRRAWGAAKAEPGAPRSSGLTA